MKKSSSIAKAVTAFKKSLLIMKLMILLVVFCTFHASAGLNAQKITLKASDTEISQVLTAIQKQGDFRFLFNSRLKDLKQKVSVSFEGVEINEVMKQLFAGTSLTYLQLDNNLVAIRSTNPEEKDIRVTGKVTDEAGEPVSAASVMVKGTANGTVTDGNGNFAITVPENATLVISAVGFGSVEVAVAGKQQLTVKLQQSTKKMDEVVVIGYGTASRRDLTGSIVKVSGKEIADKPNTNPVASLQGKVAGLTVINSGTPGQSPDIRIRGTNSLGGNLKPLYVVDGIFNDNIDYLNPADIESMEILKDPSSLAIFGVRGANGVIAITTKRGKSGQTLINFNTSYGYKKLVDKIQWASADEFKMLYDEEKTNDGTIATSPFNYGLWNANTDWVDAVTRVGNFNSNNLSLSTSTEKNKFYMGIGFTKDEGLIKHEVLKRFQLSVSDEVKVTKYLKLGFNLNASKQDNPYGASWILDAARKVIPGVSSGTKNVYAKNPYGIDSGYYDLYYELPIIQNSGVINPLIVLENEWDKTISQEYRTVGSAFAEISFLRNFTFKSSFYADMSNVNSRIYTPVYNAWDAASNIAFLYSRRTGVNESDLTYKKFQTDNILNYKTQIGKDHNLTLMTGFTTYDDRFYGRYGSIQASTTGNAIPNDKRFWYLTNGFGDASTSNSSSGQRERTTASFLGRALYNYQGKYYFNASFRRDGTSVFPNNQWQSFWAVGAAWEVTKENFMQNQRIVDFLKIKASTGVLGVQNTAGFDYPAFPLLAGGSAAIFGNSIYTAATQQYLADKNIRWESNHATEVGVELEAFNRRLRLEAAYYNKKTVDLLSYVYQGQGGNGLLNQGSLQNTGIELAGSWNQEITRDLILTIGGNFTTFNNKVISLAGSGVPLYDGPSITQVGSPIGAFYGYVVEGIYQSYADKLGSPVNTEFIYGPGDFKFKDVNGDGIINTKDKTIIGNPTPDFTYGGSVSLKYKGLDFGIDFGGVYGNEIYRMWGGTESPFQRVNYPKFKTDRWHGAGTSNWDPILGQGHRINYEYSSYGIEDGSYFRLRNIQLGYNFDQKLISKIKLKSLRIFANVQNAKTWKRNMGYSPEFGGSATQFSVDYAGNAIPVVSTFGLNVNF